jgi:hypothetical protein
VTPAVLAGNGVTLLPGGTYTNCPVVMSLGLAIQLALARSFTLTLKRRARANIVSPCWTVYAIQPSGIGHPRALGVLVSSPPNGVLLGVSVG